MGTIGFIPEAGRQYHVICRTATGKAKQFDLPPIVPGACALHVVHQTNEFQVSIKKDSTFTTDSLYLFVLQNGHPLYGKPWEKHKDFYIFPYQLFQKGTIHFLLTSCYGDILSERLAFVMHPDTVKANISSKSFSENFYPRHKVSLELTLCDTLQHRLNGQASISVTDASYQWIDSNENILSRLLLTADLHGQIEDPYWYFNRPYTSRVAAALDLVMQTHGWRKYNLKNTIKGHLAIPPFMPEGSMQIEGIVTSRMGKPAEKAELQIIAPKAFFAQTAYTDSAGRFRIDGFELPDSTRYMLTALSARGRKNIVLKINEEAFPAFSFSPTYLQDEQKPDSVTAYVYINNAIKQLSYGDGIRNFLLGDIEVVAPHLQTYHTNFEKDASAVIRENRIRQSGLPNLEMIIRGLGGLDFFHPRGSGTPALLVLDDVPIEDESSMQVKTLLQTMSSDNIEQIDIITGSKAIGYFNAKHGCIVAVRTKRGQGSGADYSDTNMAVYIPLGVQTPVSFYSPKYDKIRKTECKPDLRSTIYWKPDIELKQGKAKISFYTADRTAPYRIVLEGLSENGNIFRKECFLFNHLK